MHSFAIALLLFAFLLPYCLPLTYKGDLSWSDYGKTCTLQIWNYPPWGTHVNTQTSIAMDLNFGPRAWYKTPDGKWYRFSKLIGNTIKFEVDLTQTACTENAALYLVEFPTDADTVHYYCDAQGATPPAACVEVDLMEANKHAYQFTTHCGTGKSTCGTGCGINIRANLGYGPGGKTIDTNNPFTVEVSFHTTQYCLRLTQNGKTIVKCLSDSSCGNNYISKLASSLSSGNMVLITSYWGMGPGDWLDGGCEETTPANSEVHITDLSTISGTSVWGAQSDASTVSENTVVESSNLMAVIGCMVVVVVVVLVVVIIVLVVVLQRKSTEMV